MARLLVSVRGKTPIPWGSSEWEWRRALAERARSVRLGPAQVPDTAVFSVEIVFLMTPDHSKREGASAVEWTDYLRTYHNFELSINQGRILSIVASHVLGEFPRNLPGQLFDPVLEEFGKFASIMIGSANLEASERFKVIDAFFQRLQPMLQTLATYNSLSSQACTRDIPKSSISDIPPWFWDS